MTIDRQVFPMRRCRGGNVNVSVLDGRHYAVMYAGGTSDKAVLVVPASPEPSVGQIRK